MSLGANTVLPPIGWHASEHRILELERERKPANYRESAVPAYILPDVLRGGDGSRMTTPSQWEQLARPRILDDFSREVYGRSPPVPAGIRFENVRDDLNALNGKASYHCCRVVIPTGRPDTPYSFEVSVFVPKGKPAPTFLLLNNRPTSSADPTRKQLSEFWPVEKIIARGYAAAVIHLPDVQPDDPNGLSHGIIGALPEPNIPEGERWGAIAAWGWGASRALDWLATVPGIDASRVAVIGHSRAGKAALWAGAQDRRFAMVIANESGCMGAALSRRCFGETVSLINHQFPHWFCGNLRKFNDRVDDLPVDQHELLALIAPRPLYIAAADLDLWGDPRGQFLGLAAASPVYSLFGTPPILPNEMPALEQPLIRGSLAFHIRHGEHNLTDYDWSRYLDFADQIGLARR